MANLVKTKWCEKSWKWQKPRQMGTYLIALSESFLMNTNMTGFRWFSEIFAFLYLHESSLSIVRVNPMLLRGTLGVAQYIKNLNIQMVSQVRGYLGQIAMVEKYLINRCCTCCVITVNIQIFFDQKVFLFCLVLNNSIVMQEYKIFEWELLSIRLSENVCTRNGNWLKRAQ